MFSGLSRIAAVLCMACCFVLPVGAQDEDAERLRIHGSNTLGADLVPALVESWLASIGYEKPQRRAASPQRIEIRAERDDVPLIVEIDRRGSASGFRSLVEGDAELAMMTRAPTAAERDAGWQLGDIASPEQEFVIALDGLAVVVNARNPVRALSVAQLREVAAGRIRDWSALGGRNMPIRLHLGRAGTGSREFLQERVMSGLTVSPATTAHARLRQAAAAVAQDVDALAVVELTTRIPAGTRTLAISDGGIAVLPTRLNVASEDYPLLRRYRMYGGQLMSALGRSFALYAVGKQGQQVVESRGVHSVMLRPAMQPHRAGREPEYLAAVEGGVRLPLGLRFNITSLTTFFESRSAYDMERLVAFMRLPENRGRSLVVVAFADRDPGNRLLPRMISNERADIVAGYLTRQGITVTRSLGLGDDRPLVSAGRQGARDRNERVEVWLQ